MEQPSWLLESGTPVPTDVILLPGPSLGGLCYFKSTVTPARQLLPPSPGSGGHLCLSWPPPVCPLTRATVCSEPSVPTLRWGLCPRPPRLLRELVEADQPSQVRRGPQSREVPQPQSRRDWGAKPLASVPCPHPGHSLQDPRGQAQLSPLGSAPPPRQGPGGVGRPDQDSGDGRVWVSKFILGQGSPCPSLWWEEG